MAEELSKIKIYNRNDINVFWNGEHYPIPVTADLHSIYLNIGSALRQMGLHGFILIDLYGEEKKLNHGIKQLSDARIYYRAEDNEDSTDSRMSLDMISYGAVSQPDRPINIVVITKRNPKSELHRVLQCLKSRNHIVLLVEPSDDTAQDSLFHSVDSVVDCTQVLGGGKPISGSPQNSPSSSGSMKSDTDAANEEDVNSSVI